MRALFTNLLIVISLVSTTSHFVDLNKISSHFKLSDPPKVAPVKNQTETLRNNQNDSNVILTCNNTDYLDSPEIAMEFRMRELEGEVKKLKKQVKHLKSENLFRGLASIDSTPSNSGCVIEPVVENIQVYNFAPVKKESRHRIYGMLGYGAKGAKIQSDGNRVWTETQKGFVGGAGYQYKFTDKFNGGFGFIGAETLFFSSGSDF